MNNKHNSVLDVQQPLGNVEPVDTIEDAQQTSGRRQITVKTEVSNLPPSEHQ